MKIVAPNPENLERAAAILRSGGLVIIPTETVYGLAADALNPEAVAKVFGAKGRPADNPLIVHVALAEQALSLAAEWPDAAQILADRFWPGPLTLVVRRSARVPAETCGGLDTVAIRMPDHPVALALAELAGPLAAPSANPFTGLSATSVDHLDPALLERVDLVLDGGPAKIGIESTVVDVLASPPRILRPGGVSRGDIQAALHGTLGPLAAEAMRRSPGQYAKHYAPQAPLKLRSERLDPDQVGLTFHEPQTARQLKMPLDPRAYGSTLYHALHQLDSLHPQTIWVEMPPEEPAWEAVWDRLRKAAGQGLVL